MDSFIYIKIDVDPFHENIQYAIPYEALTVLFGACRLEVR